MIEHGQRAFALLFPAFDRCEGGLVVRIETALDGISMCDHIDDADQLEDRNGCDGAPGPEWRQAGDG